MNFKSIASKLVSMTGKTGLVCKKYSPEILMTVGVVGVVASTVMACKATLKAGDIIDETNKNLDLIKQARALDREDYQDAEAKKEQVMTYVQAGVSFAKLYGPSILLGALSISCILGSHRIMRKRNIALVAAYKLVERSFKDYRDRVVSEFGVEKDFQFKNGLEKAQLKAIEEDGTITEESVNVIDPNNISGYARFFDESCSHWSKTPEYNLLFLKAQQGYANDLLNSRGHVFLNEVYDMVGIPRSQAGSIVGWVKGEGDSFIDFGMYNGENMQIRDFVNGYERTILLDFNVDGVIYDMI